MRVKSQLKINAMTLHVQNWLF